MDSRGRAVWPMAARRARSRVVLVALAVLLLALAGCSSSTDQLGRPTDVVEFTADGPSGAAYGSYVLIGDLLSNGASTFTGLPFSARLPAPPPAVNPKMSVSVVDIPPNSRVTCRITLDGRLLVQNTGTVPGPDVVCIAPSTPTR